MVVGDRTTWTTLPQIPFQSPVLALLASRDRLWAGGFGAISGRKNGAWSEVARPLTIGAVLALAEGGSTLFAGGTGGGVRSVDGGVNWSPGLGSQPHTVLCLAPSPEYGRDETILAGTAESGILRSSDGGRTWAPAQFGMRAAEVSGLIWSEESSVLANTPGGLYRSTNGGRAWRLISSQTFSMLSQRDARLVALDFDGSVWQSADLGESWAVLGSLPAGMEPQAITLLPHGEVLVGTVESGVVSSSDGSSWVPWSDHQVLAFSVDDHAVHAGTTSGVVTFEGHDRTRQHHDSPPLHDYASVKVVNEAIFITGTLSSPQRWTEAEGWRTVDGCPSPIRTFVAGWDDDILVGTPDGLFSSDDRGLTWQQRSPVDCGDLLTLRSDGVGWLASADGSSLQVTYDKGISWSSLPSPFGVFPLVALQAPCDPGEAPLLAVTYDTSRQAATLWQSYDEGKNWKRGNDASTGWPLVATLSDPLAVSIGEAIVLRGPDGVWMRTRPGGGIVRQLARSAVGLGALTQEGIRLETVADGTWREVSGIPDQVAAFTLDGHRLIVLTTGGMVMIHEVGIP